MNPGRTSRPLRLFFFILFAAFLVPSALAQYPVYQVSQNDTAIPAGFFGLNSGGVSDNHPKSPKAPFKICFYTSFGSTTPIVPTGYVRNRGFATSNSSESGNSMPCRHSSQLHLLPCRCGTELTPVPGGSIGTEDVTIDVGPIFTTWYADSASSQHGSEFTYTQIFNLSSDASVVGQVTVTLINSVGGSPEANTP